MTKVLSPTAPLPRPGKEESTYDGQLSRNLQDYLREIAYILNNETAKQNGTSLLLYDPASQTFVPVQLGANDSGGSGYKMLRIPN